MTYILNNNAPPAAQTRQLATQIHDYIRNLGAVLQNQPQSFWDDHRLAEALAALAVLLPARYRPELLQLERRIGFARQLVTAVEALRGVQCCLDTANQTLGLPAPLLFAGTQFLVGVTREAKQALLDLGYAATEWEQAEPEAEPVDATAARL